MRRPRGVIIAAVVAVAGSRCEPATATPTFATGITTGTMTNASITEASGIAASRKNFNVLWTHNDSGNAAQIFPITPAGVNLGTYTLSGTSNVDWEDIAVGPGPTAGTQYLFVGDIGDNLAIRSTVSVYRLPEPTISDTQAPVTTSISGAQKLTFAYPNGPHDAESVFVDPANGDIYIVSKRDATKYVYCAPYPQATSGTTTMTLVASLSNSNWITAADISSDGGEIIMRSTGDTTGLMYVRPSGGTIAQAFTTTPISIPLVSEAQGEAIGFDPNGWGYYTTTEGASPPVHYFDRLPSPAGHKMYWDNDGVSAGSRTTGAGLGGTGTWNASAVKWYNGSAEVPWQNGNDAVFTGAAGTVTLGSAATVNSISFKTTGYTVTGSTLTLGGSSITVDSGVVATIGSTVAGGAGLVKSGAGTLQLTHANTYTGGTTVNAGTLKVTRLHENNPVTINAGTLQVTDSSPTLPNHPAGNNAFVSRPGSMITIANNGAPLGSRTYNATLDLGNNDLIIDYTGSATPRASVEDMLRSGFHGGDWLGKGITSSTAANPLANGNYALGVAENALLVNPFGNGTTTGPLFDGQSVDTTTVLVKFTHRIDLDLDGLVTSNDAAIFNGAFSEGDSGATWMSGDVDYDRSWTSNDAAIFNSFYDESLASLPEPGLTTIATISLGLVGFRRKRRI